MKISQKIIAVIAIIVIGISTYSIYTILRNEEPATGAPRINFVDGEFMLGDLEEIVVPVEDIKNMFKEATDEVLERSSEIEVIAENLTIPWGLDFLPNGNILVSERGGKVVDIDLDTGEHVVIDVEGVLHSGEGGLLGLAVHPDFKTNNYVYVYKTSTSAGRSINSVIRYRYHNGRFEDEIIIIDNIPGALFHDGGRIAFGPDKLLYVTTGDAQNPEFSQNLNNLAGKILRVTDTGKVPDTNPFGTVIYSYGHRNPQGLTWDEDGALWSTEHGRSGVQSGLDELNLIIPGSNYGWPKSQGNTVFSDTVGPSIHSGRVTWAPASAAYFDGSIFFGGLKGETLYQAVLDGVDIVELKEHFKGQFGRIRTVIIGPDNFLYMTTSNRDGRGDVKPGDDKIIRLDPAQFTDE